MQDHGRDEIRLSSKEGSAAETGGSRPSISVREGSQQKDSGLDSSFHCQEDSGIDSQRICSNYVGVRMFSPNLVYGPLT